MGRPPRIDSTGGWFHVVNRGAARQTIFHGDVDRVEFGRLLGVAHDRFGVVVHAYCLMTNHYHLVVECPEGQLTESMHVISSTFVRHLNERVGRDGPLFRDRYYAKPICSDEYLRRLIGYVHRNPLAIVPDADLLRYRWSSLRTYLGYRRPPAWMRLEAVLGLFGGVEGVRESALGVVDLEPATSPAAVGAAIELFLDERWEDRSRQGAARTVAVLMLDVVESATADALTSWIGSPTPGALRVARSRARSRAVQCPELRAVAMHVADFLGVTSCAWHNS